MNTGYCCTIKIVQSQFNKNINVVVCFGLFGT